MELKAFQMIEVKSSNARAMEYVEKWARIPAEPLVVAATALQDVAAFDMGLVPHIQDFPLRVRAVMLQNSHKAGTFWDDLH